MYFKGVGGVLFLVFLVYLFAHHAEEDEGNA